VRRNLGALLAGIDGRRLALDHAVVDAVLDVRAGIHLAGEEPLVVGLVLREQQRHVTFRRSECTCPAADASPRPRLSPPGRDLPEVRLLGRPVGFGDPRRQSFRNQSVGRQVQLGGVRATVMGRDLSPGSLPDRPWRTPRTRRNSGPG